MPNSAKIINEQTHFHGVFIETLGKGVFLKGVSGIGKSETALTLVERGSLLIADDVVIFSLSSNQQEIIGTCPTALKELLEVRGLGIVNMCHLFGNHVIKEKASLSLILELISVTEKDKHAGNRVTPDYSYEDILGVSIPKITISLFSNSNKALIIETAIKYHQLYHANPNKEFNLNSGTLPAFVSSKNSFKRSILL